MEKYEIQIFTERCTGCLRCELACSDLYWKSFNPSLARILDGIARRGVRFAHAFSQDPICTPSRSSMMTGRYCHAINVTSNG